jgi:nucleotide-binding universal stress UspA family protein
MTYQTILVHMKLEHTNTGLLEVARKIAERHGSRVIGLAACQPVPIVYCDVPITPMVMDQDHDEIAREMGAAEAEFRAAFHGKPNLLEWRTFSGLEPTANIVALNARCADLIITSGVCFDPADTARPENPAQIVMQTGRPVLIVPREKVGLKLDRMTIAWKDTRETRRAVADALPLLKTAGNVGILHLAAEGDRLAATASMNDVAHWLSHHGVVAGVAFHRRTKDDDAYQLDACLKDSQTDTVIAGAYGHSRLREWVLGGVTRDLTLHADYCSLLSH